MKKAYLAYGSNMSTEQMSWRCPQAKIIGTGILQNWRLMFKGDCPKVTTYATIEEWRGFKVPFVLWNLGKDEEEKLDRYEGYPKSYKKRYVEVEVNGEKYNALIYVKDDTLPVNIACEAYIEVLWEAYEKFGFDLEILEAARSFSEHHFRLAPPYIYKIDEHYYDAYKGDANGYDDDFDDDFDFDDEDDEDDE